MSAPDSVDSYGGSWGRGLQLALSGARGARGEGRFALVVSIALLDISPLVAATLAWNGLDTEQELSRIKYRKRPWRGEKELPQERMVM